MTAEYIYASNGEPLANANSEISLARRRIVRCRDCAKAERYGGELVCKLKSCAWYAVDADGYCSQGEPRD